MPNFVEDFGEHILPEFCIMMLAGATAGITAGGGDNPSHFGR